ncbi:hypothetical protein [Klebsiella pneumoniae]|uniref:hypothetical protein n=1 Tax=Klebsiella TaxID=570 RepID=UPI000E2B1790|nr:hypothetical protein [Klebsiella pneumoniae]SVY21360.1 Uncharacterised protein [Klebsiella pneumoniae]HBR4117314.1 hypothetical protein [Klebsiella pneumoniae]HBR4294673.1 hypothetical protein [Klebsiella pneumoniae]HBS6396276.1 hypothetical protein [Klebsiella pneumoniae]HBU3015678.1 hypothetical protein [Klebsiella pneumoniae]
MSFQKTITVTPVKNYDALGGMKVAGASEELKITFSAEGLVSLVGSLCTVRYSMTTEGVASPGYGEIEFQYSGTGSPLDEAEAALKSVLMG